MMEERRKSMISFHQISDFVLRANLGFYDLSSSSSPDEGKEGDDQEKHEHADQDVE
jgi:hypothetical protein